MNFNHYPFRFIQNVKPEIPCIYKKSLFSFKSPRSKQTYWVWVEMYEHNMYAVKFHLKCHRNSVNKYQIMTNLNEARAVIHTCIAVLMKIYENDSRSSFGFVGSNMIDEIRSNTKRYRVYAKIMATYFSEEVFDHQQDMKNSGYLIVRRSELKQNPKMIADLERVFDEYYDMLAESSS